MSETETVAADKPNIEMSSIKNFKIGHYDSQCVRNFTVRAGLDKAIKFPVEPGEAKKYVLRFVKTFSLLSDRVTSTYLTFEYKLKNPLFNGEQAFIIRQDELLEAICQYHIRKKTTLKSSTENPLKESLSPSLATDSTNVESQPAGTTTSLS